MSAHDPFQVPKKNPFSLQLDLTKFIPATDEEKAQRETMRESTTFFRDGMRKLFRNPLAVGSLIVLFIILVTIIVAPMVVPYTYSEMISVNGKRDKSAKNMPPFTYSKMEQQAIDEGQKIFPHIFGTDELCRDYFMRVVYGARVSLAVGFFTNMLSMFAVFGLLYWVGMARLVRGQILTIKNNEYVLAAQAIGAQPRRIIRKHILPNCMSVIFISTALQIPSAIFTESFLSFIGLGVQAPMPSLGSLANSARQALQAYPYKMVFPAVGICLIVLSFNLLGDGLRDAFDPKLRK